MEKSPAFTEALRRELPSWVTEGLVTASAARALEAKYELTPSATPGDRTGTLAIIAALTVTLTLAITLLLSGIGDGVLLPIAALAGVFAAMPLAVHGEALNPAASAVRVLGRYLFYSAAYALSFVQLADLARFRTGVASEGLLAALPLFLVGAVAVWTGWKRPDVDAHARGEAMLLVATVVAFAAGLSLDTGAGTALVATMALVFLAVGRIVRGLTSGCRSSFVEGVGVSAVLVASRGFDVFPSLWLAVAVAVVVLGAAAGAVIGFERRRPRLPVEGGPA
jgi:hypothetical protein